MATFNSIFTSCGRATLLAAVCVVVPLTASEPIAGTAVAESERSRRTAAIEEARELLRKGDEVYQAGRYAEALEAYAGARDLLPDARISAELRAAATQRYVQASIEHARVLSRNGDVAGAKSAVDKVLRDDVAPNDAQALTFRAQLDDPIRTNPALTAGHAKNIDAVRRLLYTADGAYDLGKFDEAKTSYEAVLRIDPSNTAARRGMEKAVASKSNYQKAAYDHTRAEMLSQVDAAWEIQVPAPELGVGPADPGAAATDIGKVTVAAKLDRIIIPKVSFDQITLEEAVDYLRLTTRTVDLGGTDPEYVNFTVNLGSPDSEIAKRIRAQRFDLRLAQVPLKQVLNYITELTLTSFTTDEFSVIIAPAGFTSDELITRSYRVPPDFITSLSSGATTPEAGADPFATAPAKAGLLTKRLSAQEALTQQGVLFPEGASASYSASTNMLRVVNTATNHDFISQVVAAMSQTEPVLVSVRVTMIKTQQTNLKELGFDWLVSPFALNGANSVFGSGGTVGNTTGRTGADFVSPVDGTPIYGVPTIPAVPVNSGVVTNGLRSGSHAIDSNQIDDMINNPYRDVQRSSVAPGVLAVTGLFSDSQVQMVMRGLNQKKGVDIMAQPATVTRSGQSSKIEIIREFIYPTEYEPPQIPQSMGLGTGGGFPITPSSPTAFETRNVGITLEVLPVVDANKRFVDITLNPSLSDFDGFVNYGSPINSIVTSALGGSQTVELTRNTILMPIFSVQRLATQLSVADGATIVLGGLKSERIQNVQDKVPLLGNIPVLGRLFQSTAKQPVSTAIIFMVHVELLDPTGRPYRDR
jgi:general secretion pathway protein D